MTTLYKPRAFGGPVPYGISETTNTMSTPTEAVVLDESVVLLGASSFVESVTLSELPIFSGSNAPSAESVTLSDAPTLLGLLSFIDTAMLSEQIALSGTEQITNTASIS